MNYKVRKGSATMIKEINFDMDGTIANLYGVENWLAYLIKEDTTPYAVAKPLVRFSVLARKLNQLQKQGYKLRVISWLSKNGSAEYNNQVSAVKKDWLQKRLPSVKWDEIVIVPYGTPKSTCGQGFLFDDEENNRKEWKGTAFGVENILEVLKTF